MKTVCEPGSEISMRNLANMLAVRGTVIVIVIERRGSRLLPAPSVVPLKSGGQVQLSRRNPASLAPLGLFRGPTEAQVEGETTRGPGSVALSLTFIGRQALVSLPASLGRCLVAGYTDPLS